jgi:hypothetical protein
MIVSDMELMTETIFQNSNDAVYRLSEMNQGRYGCAVKIEKPLTDKIQGKLYYPKELLTPEHFTISCWFYIPYMFTGLPDENGIFGEHNNTIIEFCPVTNNGETGLSVVANPNFTLRYPGNVVTDEVIIENTWHHMCITYNGMELKAYLNGRLKVTQPAESIQIHDNTVLMVGGGYYGVPNILIDELRIDRIARTETEIVAWHSCNTPFYPRGSERIVY